MQNRLEISKEIKDSLKAELTIRNCLQVLHTKYPGHPWLCTIIDGLIIIRHPLLTGNQCYAIQPFDLDNDYKAIMRAGGEILERFNQKRGRLDENHILNLPRDIKGMPKGNKEIKRRRNI